MYSLQIFFGNSVPNRCQEPWLYNGFIPNLCKGFGCLLAYPVMACRDNWWRSPLATAATLKSNICQSLQIIEICKTVRQ